MPDRVPLQMRFDGTLGNYAPRDLVVFGLPIAFAAINYYFGLQVLAGARPGLNANPVARFYIIPVIMVLAAIAILVFALR